MKNTDQTEPTKWERYAKGKCPSMKRRSDFNDYTDRGIYMITMAIEGRRPLLGRVEGNPDVNEGSDKPHVVLTELGRRVRECWMMIPRFYPQIEVMRLCLMPDHLHGMLFVHERMERHLGHVINGFKTGCRKVALSGGSFQNKIIMEEVLGQLRSEGFEPYYNISVSPNDGGIALGQSYIAAMSRK